MFSLTIAVEKHPFRNHRPRRVDVVHPVTASVLVSGFDLDSCQPWIRFVSATLASSTADHQQMLQMKFK